jgi:hypothetical protein
LPINVVPRLDACRDLRTLPAAARALLVAGERRPSVGSLGVGSLGMSVGVEVTVVLPVPDHYAAMGFRQQPLMFGFSG